MDNILQPGYVKWDGLKYTTDNTGAVGPTGPAGPTGPTGPAGPGVYKYLYTMSSGIQSSNLTSTTPLVIGSSYFNANEIFSISSGKIRTVTFRVELYTNDISHVAYVDLYDVKFEDWIPLDIVYKYLYTPGPAGPVGPVGPAGPVGPTAPVLSVVYFKPSHLTYPGCNILSIFPHYSSQIFITIISLIAS
jgi:hypothetical protein